MVKNKKADISLETQDEAMMIAKKTQKPGQTKEQTRLIALGIQKGIADYKKSAKNKRVVSRHANGGKWKQMCGWYQKMLKQQPKSLCPTNMCVATPANNIAIGNYLCKLSFYHEHWHLDDQTLMQVCRTQRSC